MHTLTVIVPVYNVEKYIHQCVDSLLAQDYPAMEILLIDDGSPDGCPQICDDYAKKDSRIRVIHQKNQGVAETRNIGVREAKGEYIGFLDSDDYILEGAFSRLMACFENDEEIDLAVYDYCTFYNGADDKRTVHHQEIDTTRLVSEVRDDYLVDLYPSFMSNKIYRKTLFEGITVPKGILYEDLYVMAPIIAKARKIVYIPEAFLCYRLHDSSFTMTAKIKKKWGMYLAWRERERVCKAYGCTAPLPYVRMRAEKAAISLKTIDAAAQYLSPEESADLDVYIASIEKDTSRLSLKYKGELWMLRHFSQKLCAFAGQMSIWGEAYKQRKWKK